MPRIQPSSSPGQYAALEALLKEARVAAGVTQAELASRLGWRQTDISKAERGVRRVDVIELRAWLSALGTPLLQTIEELDARLDAQETLQTTLGQRTARKQYRPR